MRIEIIIEIYINTDIGTLTKQFSVQKNILFLIKDLSKQKLNVMHS